MGYMAAAREMVKDFGVHPPMHFNHGQEVHGELLKARGQSAAPPEPAYCARYEPGSGWTQSRCARPYAAMCPLVGSVDIVANKL